MGRSNCLNAEMKSEIRKKSECSNDRNPKRRSPDAPLRSFQHSCFGSSDFFRISGFGFRISVPWCRILEQPCKSLLYTVPAGHYSPHMATEFDATEFVDEDFETARRTSFQAPSPMPVSAEDPRRAPTREEVDAKVGDLHSKLAELKRAQADLERERSTLEETRRRQLEFSTGREELLRDLNRGIQLLEEREIATRRDAEQMAKALKDLKECLGKLQAVQQEAWTKGNLTSEISRALGVVDHARMEWNSARLKFPLLSGNLPADPAAPSAPPGQPARALAGQSFLALCKLGLAFTWPIALAALAIFVVLLLKR